MHTHTARFLDSNSPGAPASASSKIRIEQLTCSLPCCHGRSNESVTGGCMVKPLVQSHCKEFAVNATGHCDKVLSGLSEKCARHALTMTIYQEARVWACFSCFGQNRIRSYHIFREWLLPQILGQCKWAL